MSFYCHGWSIFAKQTSALDTPYGEDFFFISPSHCKPRRIARWVRKARNRDVSTGPLACPFACSLAPLTRLLAPHCSLRSRAPLRSLVRSLAHSLAPELVGQRIIFVQFSKCSESLCDRKLEPSFHHVIVIQDTL